VQLTPIAVSASAFVKILHIIICIPKVSLVEDYIFDYMLHTDILNNKQFILSTNCKKINEQANINQKLKLIILFIKIDRK